MKMYIHSSFGVLDCQPMTLQAIENSIPDATMEQTGNQGDQGQPPADPSIERGVVETDECPF